MPGHSMRNFGNERQSTPCEKGKEAMVKDGIFAGSFEELEQPDLVHWVMEGFRRTLVHYGCWFREVEHQFGMERASLVEFDAGGRRLEDRHEAIGFGVGLR